MALGDVVVADKVYDYEWGKSTAGGRPPSAFIKPIVTGSKVVAHDRSQAARLVDRYASDALAIETEGHGFLEGAYAGIRGISDLLSGKDKASDDHWQPVASRHAAAFAIERLDSL